MSTKIFPFKPRKIKQRAKQIEEVCASVVADIKAKARKERKERRQIMAQLYAEDLQRRAKKLEKPCPCCGLPMGKYTEALVKQQLAKDPDRLDRDRLELARRLDEIIKEQHDVKA